MNQELKYTESDLRRGISGGLSVGMSPAYDPSNSEPEIIAITEVVHRYAPPLPAKRSLRELASDEETCRDIARLLIKDKTIAELSSGEYLGAIVQNNKVDGLDDWFASEWVDISIDGFVLSIFFAGDVDDCMALADDNGNSFGSLPNCGQIWQTIFEAGYKVGV